MKLIRGIYNIKNNPELSQGCALTIGNFDGVHCGHQQILQRLKKQGKALNVPSIVMLFEPHPREYFAQKFAKKDQELTAPARLMRLRDKINALKKEGVDFVLCIRFNEHLANLIPQDFIQQLLVEQLNVKYLSVGDDFHFGAKRAGNFKTLQQAGKQFGFTVEDTKTHIFNEQRVSSTLIREALNNDDLALAKQLLGKDYSICGRVAHGNKLGRTIGFPTANVMLKRLIIPIRGVYAVQIQIGNEIFNGVANVGNRPTIDGAFSLLEVHIFDFNRSIYGEAVEVAFLHKIRNEIKFPSFDDLKRQIQKDEQTARSFFASGQI